MVKRHEEIMNKTDLYLTYTKDRHALTWKQYEVDKYNVK
jgi:hypothetical protein